MRRNWYSPPIMLQPHRMRSDVCESAPSFSPADISGMRLFLDPRAGVTMNGSNQVSPWTDTQSGSGRSVTQATDSKKFVYTENAFGPNPGMRSAGPAPEMALSSAISGLSEFTIIFLFRPASAGLQQIIGDNAPWAIGASGFSEVYDGSSYADFSDDYQVDTDYLWIIRSGTGPSTTTALRNGVALTSAGTSGSSWNLSVTNLGSRSGTRYTDGYYGPILVYDTSLSDEDVTKIRNWYTSEGFGFLDDTTPYVRDEDGETRTSMYFDGESTVLSGGVTSDLDYVKADHLAFSFWMRMARNSNQKGSFFCRESRVSPYNGWDVFQYVDRTIGWYASHDTAGNDWMWASAPAITNDGYTWVHVVVETVGGTVAGTKFWYDNVAQTVSSRHNGLTGDMNDPTLEYLMGDADLDSGHDFYKGNLAECLIIKGQTIDETFISTYLAPGGAPAADLSTVPGAEHYWKFSEAAGDTTSTVFDRVGSVDLTVSGTAVYDQAFPG